MPDRCAIRCLNPALVASLRAHLREDEVYIALAALFSVFADPTRARIAHVLLQQEVCTCDVAATVGIRESSASQHLRILRALDVVQPRRAGKLVYYSLLHPHAARVFAAGLAQLESTPGFMRESDALATGTTGRDE